MAYVIVGHCINDTACIDVCPVDCIYPAPADPEFASADMLFIDPEICVNCNACAEACPIDAIYAETRLPKELGHYREINARLASDRQQRNGGMERAA